MGSSARMGAERAVAGSVADADAHYIQCGFAAFGAGAVSRTGQIVAISQLTVSATTQPKITSITRPSPLSTPPIFECTDRLPPMTIAAVIGAWRHITWIRTTYDASSTVIASAKGSFHGVCSPTARKISPTAQPTRVLIKRLRNILSPCFTTGSLDAIIDAIAQ